MPLLLQNRNNTPPFPFIYHGIFITDKPLNELITFEANIEPCKIWTRCLLYNNYLGKNPNHALLYISLNFSHKVSYIGIWQAERFEPSKMYVNFSNYVFLRFGISVKIFKSLKCLGAQLLHKSHFVSKNDFSTPALNFQMIFIL